MKFGAPSADAIVVRTYQSTKPEKAAKEFEQDANKWVDKGYEVLHVTGTSNKTGAAALGLGAYTVLTVTYRRLS